MEAKPPSVPSIVLRRRLREEGLSCILFIEPTELCTRLQYLNKKRGFSVWSPSRVC